MPTSHNEGMGGDGWLVSVTLILYLGFGGPLYHTDRFLCLNTRIINGFHLEVR